ncbi:AlpA family phage regulatory protein [uncultured Marinobacter sp.]|uniref:AlpA family phage regulatory protein n=1 Tax=uncultured Marinobacter sp. TaxID=187379 RepID=UPI0025EF90E4|nr:AlpA family phage regulatory protein [uncultured Marinobacter sp.]
MRILRLRDAIHTTGLGRSSLYKYSRLGKFPSATTLGGMSVGWNATAINRWIAERIRDRDQVPEGSNHVTPWAVTIIEDGTCEIDLRILRIRQVMALTGLARATVYKYINERDFPRPVPLTGSAVGWIEAEVKQWLTKCCASAATEQAPERPNTLPEAA